MGRMNSVERHYLMRGARRRQKLALDTMCFIYLLEDHPVHAHEMEALFGLVETGRCSAVTSTLSRAECLVLPYRHGRPDLVSAYVDLFDGLPNLTVVPIDTDVADLSARLRAQHRMRTPDALQVATAISSGADAFVTNDQGFLKLQEIEVLLVG
ncbi:PIN domain-containing protein [Myxococcota bacterium]|nr:PIN domain-containing protein [Myxococcota bacterium]